jgi:hypothetical protein
MTTLEATYGQTRNRKILFILWGACIIGAWSTFPWLFYLSLVPTSVSVLQLFFLGTLQAALFFGLICWLGARILPKTDLQPFRLEHPFRRVIYPAGISGMMVGLTVFLADNTLFNSTLLSGVHPPFWASALASIYGAVNEEILMRLFLLTLLYLATKKLCNTRLTALWIANFLVAIVFGLSHLPAAFKIASPSALEIVRVLVLNGIAGLVFGWLYWSRGLWSAMCAHFMADLMIHVALV